MTKIANEPVGHLPAKGAPCKPVTKRDAARLRAGSSVARDTLAKAGAAPRSIVVSKVLGANSGGAAAIGQVVDTDLQTSLPGLFVCDASVLPAAPGLPPIVTIAALALRLAAHLTRSYPWLRRVALLDETAPYGTLERSVEAAIEVYANAHRGSGEKGRWHESAPRGTRDRRSRLPPRLDPLAGIHPPLTPPCHLGPSAVRLPHEDRAHHDYHDDAHRHCAVGPACPEEPCDVIDDRG